MNSLVRVLVVAAAGILVSSCDRAPPSISLSGPTMGTTYHVTVVGRGVDTDQARLQRAIDDVLREADEHLSTYRGDSELAQLNRNASSDWIPVSAPLYDVVDAAQKASRETGGAFDVTIGPLLKLWGFGHGAGTSPTAPVQRPSPEFLLDAQASVGYRWLELRPPPARAVRKLRQPIEIDVDGIAPGYSVDRIAEAFERLGRRDYLVEIGGEVRAGGHRADGTPWQVAVEAPVSGERRAYAGLQLSGLAVSTSGNYRDSRRLSDGTVYSHTIDPRTGEPVKHDLVSVTVVHPRAVMADAYATALTVLGPRAGLEFAQKHGLAVLLLERTAEPGRWKESTTPGFERLRRPVD